MDSIVTQASDGFDKDGNFLNGQTQLLPWPKVIHHNSIYDMQSSDPQPALEDALPSPFGDGCMYTHVDGNTKIISKYDRDGELLWTFNAQTLMYNVDDIYLLHFYDDGVNKWLVGAMDNSDNYARAFRLNIDGSGGVLSPSYLPIVGFVSSFVTLEDGSLYATVSYGANKYAYSIDFETMGHIERASNDVALFGSTFATPLFNGSVLFASSTLQTSSGTGSTGTNGYASSLTVNFAVNPDLTFTEPKRPKRLLRTEHVHAISSLYAVPVQLSKDIFYCPPRDSETISGFAAHAYQARFYTRSELEAWVSNCIYASTGYRIPLSSEV